MSRYFSRLAQRSGFATVAPVRAAADIVEHDTQVDAPAIPSAAPASSAPSTPSFAPTGFVATTPFASPVSQSASASARNVSVPMRQRVAPLSTESRTSMPGESAIEHPPVTPAFAARTQSNGATSTAATPAVVTPSTTPVVTSSTSHTLPPAPAGTQAARALGSRSESSTVSVSTARAESSVILANGPTTLSSQQSVTRFMSTEPAPRAVARPPTETAPSAPRAGVSTPAPVSPPGVEVRIGAVRLEIHAPTVAPAALPAPRATSPEPPRFTPRRYYLRG